MRTVFPLTRFLALWLLLFLASACSGQNAPAPATDAAGEQPVVKVWQSPT